MSPFLPATPAYDGIGCTSTQLRPREQQTLQVKKDGRVARTAHPKPEQLTWKRYRIPLHPRATQRKSARIMFLICYSCVCKKTSLCNSHNTTPYIFVFVCRGFLINGRSRKPSPAQERARFCREGNDSILHSQQNGYLLPYKEASQMHDTSQAESKQRV